MSKLVVALRAFLGKADAACEVVSDSIVDAVRILAKDGTRAPVDEAAKFIKELSGASRKVLALQKGWESAFEVVRAVRPGKHTVDEAKEVSERAGEAFTLAAGAILNTKVTKGKADAATVASRAFKVLAELTDNQLRKALALNDGADFKARLERLAAESEVSRIAKDAAKSVRTVKPVEPIAAEAVAEPLPMLQAA